MGYCLTVRPEHSRVHSCSHPSPTRSQAPESWTPAYGYYIPRPEDRTPYHPSPRFPRPELPYIPVISCLDRIPWESVPIPHRPWRARGCCTPRWEPYLLQNTPYKPRCLSGPRSRRRTRPDLSGLHTVRNRKSDIFLPLVNPGHDLSPDILVEGGAAVVLTSA